MDTTLRILRPVSAGPAGPGEREHKPSIAVLPFADLSPTRDQEYLCDGISEDEFVAMRTQRDAQLDMPRLILPSVQVNMRAGQLPPAEDNGTRYLKIPLNAV